jgi:hypothetical protein
MKKQKHYNNCKCTICKYGVKAFRKKEANILKNYGWLVHHVFDGANPNFHTHGLQENFNHPDLQLSFPCAPETAQGILTIVADKIKTGEKFVSGNQYEDIIMNYKILFTSAKEFDRIVLRLILPNTDGKYDSAPVYKAQFDGCFSYNESKI